MFSVTCRIVHSDQIVSSNMVIRCVSGLRDDIQSPSQSYSCKMIAIFQASLETRPSKYENIESVRIADSNFNGVTNLKWLKLKVCWCS